LGIGKTRFFSLLKRYRADPEGFSLEYRRRSSSRLSAEAEEHIRVELQRDKERIEDQELPIDTYNYAALRDRLENNGIGVSTTTIIQQGCHLQKRRKAGTHDREVLIGATGDLIRHGASLHKASPYAHEKWTLKPSIDESGRMLLYADRIPEEKAWTHIQAAQSLLQTYGLPLRYYVDNLRVFGFGQKRNSFWRHHVLGTDDVDPQWRQVLRPLHVNGLYTLSPQARGKTERPYRWPQDRIVRTCALERISSLQDARTVLLEEMRRYNCRQVHSTVGEIPAVRSERAQRTGKSPFDPLPYPNPISRPGTSSASGWPAWWTATGASRWTAASSRCPRWTPARTSSCTWFPMSPEIAPKSAPDMRIPWCARSTCRSVNSPALSDQFTFQVGLTRGHLGQMLSA
jgi:hypothetical protein